MREVRFGPGAQLDEAVEGLKILGPAVGVAGVVQHVGADEHGLGPQDFGPGHRRGQKIGVAEGHIGGGDARRFHLVGGHGPVEIRQAGAADLPQVVEIHLQGGGHLVERRLGPEGLQLPHEGALAVIGMKQGQVKIPAGHRRGHATVQPAAGQDYCGFRFSVFGFRFHGSKLSTDSGFDNVIVKLLGKSTR